jgi:hypothetical protein
MSSGSWLNNLVYASSPPAEPPTQTIGKSLFGFLFTALPFKAGSPGLETAQPGGAKPTDHLHISQAKGIDAFDHVG